MKFTVVGAGAIGGVLGAHLIRAGHEVVLCDVETHHVQAMNETGLRIEGPKGNFRVPAKAYTPLQLIERKEALGTVLLCVKSQHTDAAVRQLLPILGKETLIVSCQNGLCEDIIAGHVGRSQTIGCFVNFSADYLEPGRILYGGASSFYLGELDGQVTKRIRQLQQALSDWGPVDVTDNIWGYLWGKLSYAALLFATATVDATMADVVRHPKYRQMLLELTSEVLEAADGQQIVPQGFDDWEPSLVYPRASRDEGRLAAQLELLANRMATNKKTKSGIWRDLAVRKRKTEVDFQLQPVLYIGRNLGVEMPLLTELIRMIHELEAGTRHMGWDNLDALNEVYLAGCAAEPQNRFADLRLDAISVQTSAAPGIATASAPGTNTVATSTIPDLDTWSLGNLNAARGTKTTGHLDAPGLANPLPVFLIHGVETGPTVLVMGGIHGCEYSSIDAALQIGRSLQPQDIRGRVVVIPIANPDSFYARSIYVHPADGKNLNRSFPGREDGTQSERLAHFLFQTVMEPVDYVIDLHGGDMIEALVPFSIYHVTGDSKLDDETLDLTRTFGIPYVIASRGQVPGSTYGAAAEAGKRALIAESGQQGILSPESTEQLQRGVQNVLAKIGVLSEAVQPMETKVLHQFDWYRADVKGLWYPAVRVGDVVRAGQELGVICDEFGNPVQTYTAATDGTVLFLVTSLAINADDPLLALGDA